MVRTSKGVLKVVVQPPSVEVLLHPGGRLLDAIDELVEPPLAFGCRDASCGLCTVEVLRGAALLQPAARDERQALAQGHAGPGDRLACQLRAGDLAGEVVLTPRRRAPPG